MVGEKQSCLKHHRAQKLQMFSNQNSPGRIRGIHVTGYVENASTSPTLMVMGIGGKKALDELSNKMVMATVLGKMMLNQMHEQFSRMSAVKATEHT